MVYLNDLARVIHRNACDHGWWGDLSDYTRGPATPGETVAPPNARNFGEILALIHSEVSEALEEYRDGRLPTETHYKWSVKPGQVPFQYTMMSGGKWLVKTPFGGDQELTQVEFENLLRAHKVPLKPEGVPSEFADIIIRVLDACAAYGIDIDAAITEKMAYNETRPYKHGRVV